MFYHIVIFHVNITTALIPSYVTGLNQKKYKTIKSKLNNNVCGNR